MGIPMGHGSGRCRALFDGQNIEPAAAGPLPIVAPLAVNVGIGVVVVGCGCTSVRKTANVVVLRFLT